MSAIHRDTPPEDEQWCRQVSWLAGPGFAPPSHRPGDGSGRKGTKAHRLQSRGRRRSFTGFPLSPGRRRRPGNRCTPWCVDTDTRDCQARLTMTRGPRTGDGPTWPPLPGRRSGSDLAPLPGLWNARPCDGDGPAARVGSLKREVGPVGISIRQSVTAPPPRPSAASLVLTPCHWRPRALGKAKTKARTREPGDLPRPHRRRCTPAPDGSDCHRRGGRCRLRSPGRPRPAVRSTSRLFPPALSPGAVPPGPADAAEEPAPS